jgi:hypothetical protein
MQKKLFLILFFTLPLLTSDDSRNPENFSQCNERLFQLLEKQTESNDKVSQLLQKQTKLQEEANERLSVLSNAALLSFGDRQEQIEAEKARREHALAIMQEEENKPWYQKTWDLLAPQVQHAVLRLIIASITGKVLNGTIATLDHVTGDFLVQNGYDKWAIYAGTFIVEESISGYLKKKDAKKTLADPEVQAYMATMKKLRKEHGPDIAKGEIIIEALSLGKKAKVGQAADEHLRQKAEEASRQPEFPDSQTWRNVGNPLARR